MSKSNHAIIFIPGFKGSTLHDQHEKFIWPNVLSAQFSRHTLHFDLPELALTNDLQLHAEDIVKSATVIPSVLSIDIYGKFFAQLENRFSKQAKVIAFHYDWRDHLESTVSKLNQLILKLKSEGINKIDLICHSMGGLIASYLLRYGSDGSGADQREWALSTLINRIYCVGTPFHGSLRSLMNLINGASIGLNRSLLSQSSYFGFPSLYYLLPLNQNLINIHDGEETGAYSLNDLETWDKLKLDILNPANNAAEICTRRRKYLGDCVAAAANFRARLHAKSEEPTNAATQFIHITAKNRKALTRLDIARNEQLNWQYGVGDGVVLLDSTIMPDGFTTFESKHFCVKSEHSMMFADREVQEIIYQEVEATFG